MHSIFEEIENSSVFNSIESSFDLLLRFQNYLTRANTKISSLIHSIAIEKIFRRKRSRKKKRFKEKKIRRN